ncbi:MAG TPA: CehA/McbA family metallohydrolase, partial [Polyangiaceae bacterium]|nr:CehA/McbA family metallohydrolase [Polyangiaceae bacterium]
ARIASTPGVEITTPAWGHFNSYPYQRAEPPPYAGVTPSQIFGSVRASAPGALIQINHPRMGDIGYFNQARLDTQHGVSDAGGFSFDFDVIEVLNGFEHDLPTMERNVTDWYGLLNLGRRYTAVGNSDSHRLVTQWAGYPRTYVQVTPDTPATVTAEQVRDALRRGRALVTTGPFLELRAGGRGLGELVRVQQASVKVELKVQAPPWVELHHARLVLNGHVVRDVTIPPQALATDRFSYSTELAVDRDAWLVAVVWGDTPLTQVLAGTEVRPFAFTNPIHLDANGDGLTRLAGR